MGERRLKKSCTGSSYCCLQRPSDESLWNAPAGECLYGQQHVKGYDEKCEAGHCKKTYFPCACMTQDDARKMEGGRRVGMAIAAGGAFVGMLLFCCCAAGAWRKRETGRVGGTICFGILVFFAFVMLANVVWMSIVSILADPDGYAVACG